MENIFVRSFFQLDIGQAVARELWASQADLEALTGAPAKKPKESMRYVDRCHLGDKQKQPWKQPSYLSYLRVCFAASLCILHVICCFPEQKHRSGLRFDQLLLVESCFQDLEKDPSSIHAFE